MKEKKSQIVELDLEGTIPADTLAKLYYLCKKRNLLFPEGIAKLMQEVIDRSGLAKSSKGLNNVPPKSQAKGNQDKPKAAKNGGNQPQQKDQKGGKQGRAKANKSEKQGRAKAQPKPSPRSTVKKQTNRRHHQPSTSTSLRS